MSRFRDVTARFAVSPQIGAHDVATAKAEGFDLIINNRPDGEAADQPTSAGIEAVARAQGLTYVHIPITGRPTQPQIEALARCSAGGRTLAFCRSGTRSILAWALARLAAGDGRADIVRLAAAAGYDLSQSLPPPGGDPG